MSRLETVAAAVGITDVALRGVVTLYNFVRDLEGVPEEVQNMRREVTALERIL